MKKLLSLFPFRGLFTVLDTDAPDGYASDMLNVRVGDGKARPRYGYRNLQIGSEGALDTPVTAVYGFKRLNGYDDSNVNQEEWVSIEKRNGTVRPYTSSKTTGARTEIKNGVTRQSLQASSWVGFEFQGDSYWVNPDSTPSVYKHQIGDATSWAQIGAITAPAALTLTTTPTAFLDFDSGTVAVTGASASPATAPAIDGNQITVYHKASTTGAATFEIDLSGSDSGIQDWTYKDHIILSFLTPTNEFAINWDTMAFEVRNNDGSPLLLTTSAVVVTKDSATNDYIRYYTLYWDDKTRANFDNVRKIKCSYSVITSGGTVANNLLVLSSLCVGYIDFNYPDSAITNPVYFGITYYDSANDIESDMKTGTVYEGYLDSTRVLNTGFASLASQKLTFTWAASASADKTRIYAKIGDQYLRIAEVADTTLTYDLIRTRLDVIADNNVYTSGSFADQTGIVSGFGYKGWVIWLYSGGYQNVRHSRVGSPAVIAGDVLGSDTDVARPATYSLADNYADEPLGGVQAGEPCFILGHEGVYAQAGDTPATMTPPRRLPGSMGCAGKYAFARFRTDSGEPGVAWLDSSGNVWFASSNALFAGDASGKPTELSAPIRGFIRDFLLTDQVVEFSYTDLSAARLDVDEATGSLWVVMGKRALVFRPPSQIDDIRQWEAYEYRLTTSAGSSTDSVCTSFTPATGNVQTASRTGSAGAWTTRTKAKVSDDVYATSCALASADKTEYLKVLGLTPSVTISGDATLTTCTVRVEHKLTPDPSAIVATLDHAQLMDAGTPIGTSVAASQVVPYEDGTVDLEFDLTGLGVTPTKVNAGDIGIRLGYTAT